MVNSSLLMQVMVEFSMTVFLLPWFTQEQARFIPCFKLGNLCTKKDTCIEVSLKAAHPYMKYFMPIRNVMMRKDIFLYMRSKTRFLLLSYGQPWILPYQ